MSLVLAFGLSPLGQVPAYADDEAPQTQSAELLQTQEKSMEFAVTYKVDGDDALYQTSPEGVDGPAYNGKANRELKVTVRDSGDNTKLTLGTDYKITLTDPAGEKQTAEAASGKLYIDQKGTYTLKVVGIGGTPDYEDVTATVKFNVVALNIKDFVFVPATIDGTAITNVNQLAFTGNDRTVTYKLAENNALDAALADLEQAEIVAANYDDEGVALKADLTFGKDFDASAKTLKDAGAKDMSFTSLGSCTGTAAGSVGLSQVNFVTGGKGYVTSAGVANSVAQIGAATYKANVNVPVSKAQSPVELKWLIGNDAVSATSKWVKLTEKSDYTVSYYSIVNGNQRGAMITGALTSVIGEKYMAVVKMARNSTNFAYDASEIELTCTVTAGGLIEDVADGAELAAATYMGGQQVPAVVENGAVFKKGTDDVSSLIGNNFQIDPGDAGYSIPGTNTAATASLAIDHYNYYKEGNPNVAVDQEATIALLNAIDEDDWTSDEYTVTDSDDIDGKSIDGTNVFAENDVVMRVPVKIPVGAGTYTVKVTGDEKYTENTDSTKWITATYTVAPRVAKEGTDKGDLKITVNNVPYNNGQYVNMAGQYKVQMYTVANGSLIDVPATVDADADNHAALSDTTNWTVKYMKDGKEVSKPSEVGTYQAVFSFSGNLEGTPDIVKEFKVDKGEASSIIGSVQMKRADGYEGDPLLTYTGKELELSKDDLVLIAKDGSGEVDGDLLVGTDYELSYAKGTATPEASGKPKAQGSYVVTATFSGNYEGTVEFDLNVEKLDLRKLTTQLSANAELQYQQSTGSWDTTFSAVKTGSAITPTVRVAVKDGKERTSEPTLVDESVYTATFSENVDPGKAKVTVVSSDGANVHSSTAAQAGAFTITDKSFSDIAANLKLSKSEVDYGYTTPLTLQLESSEGALVYGASQDVVTYAGGDTRTVTVSGVTAWTDGTDWFTTETGNVEIAGTSSTNASDVTVPTNSDRVKVTGLTFTTDKDSSPAAAAVLYYKGGTYYSDDAATEAYATPGAKQTFGNATGTVAVNNYVAYVKGTATVQATNVKLWKHETTGVYYIADAAEPTAFTGTIVDAGTTTSTAGTNNEDLVACNGVTVAYDNRPVFSNGTDCFHITAGTPDTATDLVAGDLGQALTTDIGSAGSAADSVYSGSNFVASEGADYTLKVLDSKGNDVKGVTFASTTAPYTTVTVNGIKDAGEYKIVATAGSNGMYGGRVEAPLTVKGTSIEDTSKFLVTYVGTESDGVTPKTLTLDEDWAVTYSPAQAKSTKGITLVEGDVTIRSANGDTLVNGTDYKITYEDNFKAGTAKATIAGIGNYAGSFEKPFTIKRINLDTMRIGTTGIYQVDFVETSTFKKTVNQAAGTIKYNTPFTGSAITPDFEINFYPKDANTLDITEATQMLDDEYTVQWTNNTDVMYDYNSPNVGAYAKVTITATGNYEGTIEGKFQIDPIDLYNNSAVAVSPVSEQVWTGQQVIPAVTVTLNGVQLTQGTDYVVTLNAGDNGTDEGEHTALIATAGKGNVTVSTPIQVKYTIKKASEIKYDLTGATVALSKTKYTYNGKAQAPAVKSVTLADGTLLDAALYTATVPSKKAAGDYTVTVKGAAENVTGTATAKFTIAKAANTLKVAKAKRAVKYAKLKKAAQKVTGLKVSAKGQGKVTYKVAKVVKGKKSVSKASFKLAKATANKLTVKKGLAKGTYKVTMTAKAKGNANYNASKALKKVVTVVVK